MHSIALRAIVLLTLGVQTAHPRQRFGPEVKEHLHQVAEGLPSDSLLRKELDQGVHGDGVHYPWMDQMKQAGVKRVEFEIRLSWFFGPRFMKIARVMYFTNFDGPESQITDPEQIKRLKVSGLEQELEGVALARGSHGSWFESPLAQHPPHLLFMPAATMVELLDDEWLPILPTFYWDFDTSWTPLDDAVAMDDRFAMKNLLSNGNLKPADLDKALSWAAAGADSSAVEDILTVGARVNSKGSDVRTPIFAAISNDRIANVEILLDAGADPNARSTDTGDTPLITAASYNKVDALKILLKYHADRAIKNNHGETAISIARSQDHREIAEILAQ